MVDYGKNSGGKGQTDTPILSQFEIESQDMVHLVTFILRHISRHILGPRATLQEWNTMILSPDTLLVHRDLHDRERPVTDYDRLEWSQDGHPFSITPGHLLSFGRLEIGANYDSDE